MGTSVAVYIGTDTPRTGRIQHVTADVLALRERPGLSMIPRPQVERVSTREPAGTRQWPHVLEGGLIGAAAAVPVALLVSAHDEQGTGHAAPLVAALLGAGLGAVAGSTRAPEQTFRERIIYIRP
jgi:hypothetical protein